MELELSLDFASLKARQREDREYYPQAIALRIHRALSWLNKAEQCQDDDAKFIFLWIAFNSAYAQEFEHRLSFSEKGLYQEFLKKLVELDREHRLADIIWDNYSKAIRGILNNEFILKEYWDYQAGKLTEDDWKLAKSKANAASNQAIGLGDTQVVLSIVFSRLYTLRNQIIHGGATYNSSANRDQLRDCTRVLEQVVPVIIEIMMSNPNQLWGEAVFPLIEK